MKIFDTEEIIENCTVQILRNSETGDCSVGWWKNEEQPVAIRSDEDER